MWSSARCSVSVQDSWCSRPAVHLPKTRGAFSGTSVFGGSDPAPTSREPALSWAHARNHCPAPPVECPRVNQGLSTQRPSLQPAHSGSHPAPQRPPSDLPRAELPPAFLSLVLTHRPPKWAPRLLQEQRQVGTLTSPRCDTWVQWLSKSDLFWVQKVGGAWERQAAGVPCTDCEHPEGRHSLFPVWVPSALY